MKFKVDDEIIAKGKRNIVTIRGKVTSLMHDGYKVKGSDGVEYYVCSKHFDLSIAS